MKNKRTQLAHVKYHDDFTIQGRTYKKLSGIWGRASKGTVTGPLEVLPEMSIGKTCCSCRPMIRNSFKHGTVVWLPGTLVVTEL